MMTIRPHHSATPEIPSRPETYAGRFAADTTCAALIAVEAIGSLTTWALAPLSWLWIGGRVYRATGSLGIDMGVVICGFGVTAWLLTVALHKIDRVWIALRRRAGHDQADGALDNVVVVSMTVALALFLLWYYALERAFVMPFMPLR